MLPLAQLVISYSNETIAILCMDSERGQESTGERFEVLDGRIIRYMRGGSRYYYHGAVQRHKIKRQSVGVDLGQHSSSQGRCAVGCYQ